MRNRLVLILAGSAFIVGGLAAQTARKPRLNPVIELLEQKKPVFGLYAPSNRRGGPGGRGAPGGGTAQPRHAAGAG